MIPRNRSRGAPRSAARERAVDPRRVRERSRTMRAVRRALAATGLAAAACASTAGVWNDSFANMDQKMLRAEITKTLAADSWTTREENNLLIGQKNDGAGHQTAAVFSFQDAAKGSSYEMTG